MVIEDKITMHWYEDKSVVNETTKEVLQNLTTAEEKTNEEERESNPMLGTHSSVEMESHFSDEALKTSSVPGETKAIIKESFKAWNNKIDSVLNKDAL